MQYNGIELEPAHGPVTMSHSIYLDLIHGQSSTANMDWTEKLFDLPWGKLKESFPASYEAASRLSSLLNMDYQVCNGGIDQYFFNGYHEERDAFSENDVIQVDLDGQKETFEDLVAFGKALFPEREEDNQRLSAVCTAFQALWLEEDVPIYKTVECDEPEFIYDEDLGEEIPNPDYEDFEPYEECVGQEDVIRGDDLCNFDETFYEINSYLEELCELRAQFLCKQLSREVARFVAQYDALRADVETVLGPEALTCSLADKIAAAEVQQNKQVIASQKQRDDDLNR